jgi:hypothetical protein
MSLGQLTTLQGGLTIVGLWWSEFKQTFVACYCELRATLADPPWVLFCTERDLLCLWGHTVTGFCSAAQLLCIQDDLQLPPGCVPPPTTIVRLMFTAVGYL